MVTSKSQEIKDVPSRSELNSKRNQDEQLTHERCVTTYLKDYLSPYDVDIDDVKDVPLRYKSNSKKNKKDKKSNLENRNLEASTRGDETIDSNMAFK